MNIQALDRIRSSSLSRSWYEIVSSRKAVLPHEVFSFTWSFNSAEFSSTTRPWTNNGTLLFPLKYAVNRGARTSWGNLCLEYEPWALLSLKLFAAFVSPCKENLEHHKTAEDWAHTAQMQISALNKDDRHTMGTSAMQNTLLTFAGKILSKKVQSGPQVVW